MLLYGAPPGRKTPMPWARSRWRGAAPGSLAQASSDAHARRLSPQAAFLRHVGPGAPNDARTRSCKQSSHAIQTMAAHCEPCSASRSRTRGTARSRTSGEYLFDVLMTLSSQNMESPGIPERFTMAGKAVVLLLSGSDKANQKAQIDQAVGYWNDCQRRT